MNRSKSRLVFGQVHAPFIRGRLKGWLSGTVRQPVNECICLCCGIYRHHGGSRSETRNPKGDILQASRPTV